MKTRDILDLKKRPPRGNDVVADAMFGGSIPEHFIPGHYYEEGERAYTVEDGGNTIVWECKQAGSYLKPGLPGWEKYSIDELRKKIDSLEEVVGNLEDIYDTKSYDHSYLIHDVGVRDWEHRGSFLEVFNDNKYLSKKNYRIDNEEVISVDEEHPLPEEYSTTLYLNKSSSDITNLIRRIETYGAVDEQGRIIIQYPFDMTLAPSYIFDLYIDGLYISDNFILVSKEADGTEHIIITYDTPLSLTYQHMIEDGNLSINLPVSSVDATSEIVFVFYVSVSHDLTLMKQDLDKFIGDERDGRWMDVSELGFIDNCQEISVFNNGVRLRETQYQFSGNRISVDKEEYRFQSGTFATVSMKTFKTAVDGMIPNVKEETLPIIEEYTKLFPIPFLHFDENRDHYLLFNDGGVHLGNQKWFVDNGFVNVYDDDLGLTPNDMVEFRMISRDNNMVVTVYSVLVEEDHQVTFVLPIQLREHYFHMIFSETGQFISRTKYAVSGNIMQFRSDYGEWLTGERFEIIMFDYVGDYGFTSLRNYVANWDPKYAELSFDIVQSVGDDPLPEPNPEPEEPGDGENTEKPDDTETTEPNPEPEEPIKDPALLTLPEDETTGKTYTKVVDVATGSLRSKITRSPVSLVDGVDCDHQIVCSTYYGDILRFNSKGEEDTRFSLKEVGSNSIDMIASDDFGFTYFHTYSTLDIDKVDVKGNRVWKFRNTDTTEPIQRIYSIQYLDGWLYVEYSPYAVTEVTMGRINAETGKFSPIPISFERNTNIWCAKLCPFNNHIFLGGQGHTVYEFTQQGILIRSFSDDVVDYDFGLVKDVYCDGQYGNVYVVSELPNENGATFLKYNFAGDLVYSKEFYGIIKMAFDCDGYPYLFDYMSERIIKLGKGDNYEEIWEYKFENGIDQMSRLFIDQTDYHVYAYYINNNDPERYRYVELAQSGLPRDKVRVETVFYGDEPIIESASAETTVRDLQRTISSTNRIYIGTMDGSVCTFTPTMKSMIKDRTLNLWRESNPDIPLYIIPDDEYNFYVIKENKFSKWNRYERKLWEYDGSILMTTVLRQIALNPVTKDLVFLYGSTDGRHSLGKLNADGIFENLTITLPNGVLVEDADCAISCNKSGQYFFGYSGATIYRYSKNFNYMGTFGTDTTDLLDGPVGTIIHDKDERYLYITVKNRSDEEQYDKIIKYNQLGNIVWAHDFMSGSNYGNIAMDKDGNLYHMGETHLRKIDPYGNYLWRISYEELGLPNFEPITFFVDEYYRVFFIDEEYKLMRIDQYQLTFETIPEEAEEPEEPSEPVDPIDPIDPPPPGWTHIQKTFDLPFTFDPTTQSMLLFTNTGQYIGKRFYDIDNKQLKLKGSPIYENGWIDIVLIENVKESIVLNHTGGSY